MGREYLDASTADMLAHSPTRGLDVFIPTQFETSWVDEIESV